MTVTKLSCALRQQAHFQMLYSCRNLAETPEILIEVAYCGMHSRINEEEMSFFLGTFLSCDYGPLELPHTHVFVGSRDSLVH